MLIGYIDWMTDVSFFLMLINEYRIFSLYHPFSFQNRMF